MIQSIIRWMTSRELEDDLWALACGLALCLYLWMLKIHLAAWFIFARKTPVLEQVPALQIPLLGGGDLLLCIWVALLYVLLFQLGRCLARPGKVLVAGAVPFTIHCGLVLFSTVSWQVNQIYGAPLDITHVRAADDLRMMSSSILAYLNALNITFLILGVASYPLLAPLLARLLRNCTCLLVRWRVWTVAMTIAIVVGGLWVRQMRGVYTFGLKSNALIHFAQYYTRPPRPADWPAILRQLTTAINGQEQDLCESASLSSANKVLTSDVHLTQKADDYNLLLIILESTSRLYLDDRTTPNMHRLAANGLSFANHFTTIAETHRAVYSILYSDYLSDSGFRLNEIYDGPVPLPTLADVAHSRGYATGFFHSGYISYAGLDYLLNGYDTRIGAKEMPKTDNPWAWGVFEEQTVAALSQWISSHKQQRFFATYSTIFPHHPYLCSLPKKPFSNDTWATRYRNSLYYVDRNIGQLIDHLQKEGLRDNTLVVILADHGESTTAYPVGHGSVMSMEEICVPFIISNPRLFPTPQVSHISSNHLDVAPTLAGLLSITPPSQWLGRNLLFPQIAPKLLFLRLPQAKLTGVVDNGLLYVCDDKSGKSTLNEIPSDRIIPLPQMDSRNTLLPAYRSKADLFKQWAVWRHLHRALQHRAPTTNVASTEAKLHPHP